MSPQSSEVAHAHGEEEGEGGGEGCFVGSTGFESRNVPPYAGIIRTCLHNDLLRNVYNVESCVECFLISNSRAPPPSRARTAST